MYISQVKRNEWEKKNDTGQKLKVNFELFCIFILILSVFILYELKWLSYGTVFWVFSLSNWVKRRKAILNASLKATTQTHVLMDTTKFPANIITCLLETSLQTVKQKRSLLPISSPLWDIFVILCCMNFLFERLNKFVFRTAYKLDHKFNFFGQWCLIFLWQRHIFCKSFFFNLLQGWKKAYFYIYKPNSVHVFCSDSHWRKQIIWRDKPPSRQQH